MKTVVTFLIFFLSFSFIEITAQEVVSTSGGYYSNAYGSISFTIGEPVIETFTGTQNILTQGFEQSRITVTDMEPSLKTEIIVKANPNPAGDFLNVSIENSTDEDMKYRLINSQGDIICEEDFKSNEIKISCSQLISSVYILKIYCKDSEIKSLKIIKL